MITYKELAKKYNIDEETVIKMKNCIKYRDMKACRETKKEYFLHQNPSFPRQEWKKFIDELIPIIEYEIWEEL